MKIKIAIASNKKFYQKSLPILLPTLFDAGIEKQDITVFIGGCDEEKQENKDGVDYYYLNYDNFELSALIAICDKQLVSDYWFLLHDTTKVGSRFKELLYSIPESNPEKIALKQFPAMSMGCYRYDYLLSVRDSLLNIRNTNFSPEHMKHVKVWAVNNEDFILWKHSPTPSVYEGDEWSMISSEENWYKTETLRCVEYYPSLDIYKNKANWSNGRAADVIDI